MDFEGKRGSGRFQWNRGGWFGGQVGATLWLVLLGVLLAVGGQRVGIVVAALGLLPNLVGLVLWRYRRRLAPYGALQVLVATAGVAALVAMLVLVRFGVPMASLRLPSGLWFLLIYPGVMLVFYLQERSARGDAGP